MISKPQSEGRRRIDGRKADWLPVHDAIARVVAGVPTLGAETVPITSARRRVLADDVVARVDVPRWTNSAMDGFAVRGADVEAASTASPVELPVVDDVAAGAFPRAALKPGTAVRVMTGAPVPDGADSVVRVEHTDGGVAIGTPEGKVRIVDGQDAGRNLRRQGEDLRSGTIALPRGTLMTPGAVGVAASLGCASLSVVERPVVALLT
jgi:molybdopterin molybdotransferase